MSANDQDKTVIVKTKVHIVREKNQSVAVRCSASRESAGELYCKITHTARGVQDGDYAGWVSRG